MNTQITPLLSIEHPIIMAPMFLVSNEAMMKAAIDNGTMGVFPSLNYRSEEELSNIIDHLNQYNTSDKSGNYGINLIVQKSNIYYKKHLEICIEKKVPFFITSLGNPKEVIERAHAYGGKVFCDVTNLTHAQKVYDLGCDGFIAVGQGAGGHAGPHPLQVLVPSLVERFPDKPVIAAGGIATGQGILSVLVLGAQGVSIGTRFIASEEANVSDAYKNGIVKAGMDDIVMTERLSGTPATVINTPAVKKMGLKQNWLERAITHNKKLKKYFKMFVQMRGMKKLEQSIKPGNYNNLWSAGKSSALIHNVRSCKQIIEDLIKELESAKKSL